MQASPLWARIPTALTPLIALVLAVLLLVSSGCSRLKPEAAGRPAAAPGPGPSSPVSQGRLQEVAPPTAVVALAERLGDHNPAVQIVAPADDSLLSEGPWTLQLKVSDWPLADAGRLGPGPHLVVQVDQQEPLRITDPDQAAALVMPELPPGSHRISVYAARPWGEAVKSPGAMRQIRVHRVGRNAAELPARGSAQLIVASPDGLQRQEPVLIDWLLLDAPLQHLRDDDARWRLRVSVNGDSFLVDRQTPLWLKGFRRGSNAVQLELLDGRGEPLNPPFNSLVREVVINTGERPAWLAPNLSNADLGLLSGERVKEPDPTTTPAVQGEPVAPLEWPAAEAMPTTAEPDAAAAEETDPAGPEAREELAPASDEAIDRSPALAPEPPETPKPNAAAESSPAATEAAPPAALPPPEDASPVPASPADRPQAGEAPAPAPAMPPPPAPQKAPAIEPAQPATGDNASERISAGTSLSGSAREQVSADGSLLRPKGRGPLAGLREKLGG